MKMNNFAKPFLWSQVVNVPANKERSDAYERFSKSANEESNRALIVVENE